MSKKLTQDEFIKRSIAVHGDRYDYSKSVYVAAPSKLIITCKKHGDFLQSPNKHFSGRGCKACGYESISIKNAITYENFESMARNKHGDRFEYDQGSYSGIESKIKIKCPAHGWRSVIAISHIKSETGCRKCGQLLTGSKNSYDVLGFIERANKRHGIRYDYSKVVYVDSKTNITIRCIDHGDFVQIPGNHIYGSGCPSCVKNGFSPDLPSILYLLKSECGSMMKIGITRNLAQRASQLRRATPFSFEVEASISMSGGTALKMEKYYHSKSMSCELSGFHGASEWFRYDDDIAGEIKKGGLSPLSYYQN